MIIYYANDYETKMMATEPAKHRASYLTVAQQYNLAVACQSIHTFGYGTFLVGSVLTRPDYRDVDLRCMLSDEEFEVAFLGDSKVRKLAEVAISEWIAARTGLPIDFQFQQASAANKEFTGPRNGIGLI